MRTCVLTALLLGAVALLPCRPASAQGVARRVERFPVHEIISPAVSFSPPLQPGWWRTITDALDAMRGLRGRRIPPLAARQVDLRTVATTAELLTHWQELPRVTQVLQRRLDLRFGPVHATPLRIEPVTASVVELRGESGELLGAAVTLPWLVP